MCWNTARSPLGGRTLLPWACLAPCNPQLTFHPPLPREGLLFRSWGSEIAAFRSAPAFQVHPAPPFMHDVMGVRSCSVYS